MRSTAVRPGYSLAYAECFGSLLGILVQTLDGPLEVRVGEDLPRPRFVVGRPQENGEEERAQLPWPDAPARRVYVVQYVDGRWRVVREEEGFTS